MIRFWRTSVHISESFCPQLVEKERELQKEKQERDKLRLTLKEVQQSEKERWDKELVSEKKRFVGEWSGGVGGYCWRWYGLALGIDAGSCLVVLTLAIV